jgi:plasmid stabilization system protein ParE
VSLPLDLHEDADRELSDAAQYYDGERPGLGAAFVDEVEAGFARIVEHPSAAPELTSGVRKLVLARFPYSLIYDIDASPVHVLAVAHQRKRPFYWRGRR